MLLALYLIRDILWGYRPLFSAKQWQVKAGTHSGKPLAVKIYKRLGSEKFYLRIDGGGDAPLCYWPSKRESLRWFTMNFPDDKERIITKEGTSVRTFPYPCSRNRDSGLNILSEKFDGEVWCFSYTGDSVVFSNDLFFVSATQENSGRPPVEVHRSTRDAWRKEWQ